MQVELYINGSRITGVFNEFYKDSRHRFWISSIDNGIGYWDSSEAKINYIVTASELAALNFNLLPVSLFPKMIIVEDMNGRIWFYRNSQAIGFLGL